LRKYVMTFRPLLLAAVLIAALPAPALAGDGLSNWARATADFALPVLRANVAVTSDIVRIGDVIDNAGPAGQIAIYRAPDLGTTGSPETAPGVPPLGAPPL